MKHIKTSVSKFKQPLWEKHFGNNTSGNCLCCIKNKITYNSYHAGHIIPEKFGGEAVLFNLLPICKTCNLKMSTTYLLDYAKNIHNNTIELDADYQEYQQNNLDKFENEKQKYKNKMFIKHHCNNTKSNIEKFSEVIDWLIYNKLLHPGETVENYNKFIEEKPEGRIYRRIDEFRNIHIGDIAYRRIYISSKTMGNEGKKPIVEICIQIETKETEFCPIILWDIYVYVKEDSITDIYTGKLLGIQYKDYKLWIEEKWGGIQLLN